MPCVPRASCKAHPNFSRVWCPRGPVIRRMAPPLATCQLDAPQQRDSEMETDARAAESCASLSPRACEAYPQLVQLISLVKDVKYSLETKLRVEDECSDMQLVRAILMVAELAKCGPPNESDEGDEGDEGDGCWQGGIQATLTAIQGKLQEADHAALETKVDALVERLMGIKPAEEPAQATAAFLNELLVELGDFSTNPKQTALMLKHLYPNDEDDDYMAEVYAIKRQHWLKRAVEGGLKNLAIVLRDAIERGRPVEPYEPLPAGGILLRAVRAWMGYDAGRHPT